MDTLLLTLNYIISEQSLPTMHPEYLVEKLLNNESLNKVSSSRFGWIDNNYGVF